MKKVVHFDKDGTLILSEDRNRGVIQKFAEELFGIPNDQKYWDLNLWPICAGSSESRIAGILREHFAEEQKDEIVERIDAFCPEEFERLCKEQWPLLSHLVSVRPYAVELMQAYKDRGYLVALVTNSDKQDTEADFVKMFGSVEAGYAFFDSVVTLDDVGEHRKPSPVPYLLSCQKLGISLDDDAQHTVFEDSPTGFESALEAFSGRAQIYGFTYEFMGAPEGVDEIECFTEALEVLEAEPSLSARTDRLARPLQYARR